MLARTCVGKEMNTPNLSPIADDDDITQGSIGGVPRPDSFLDAHNGEYEHICHLR